MPSTIKTLTATIDVNTVQYTAGDLLGTAAISFNAAQFVGGLILESVVITDKSKQSAAIDLLFFSSACTNSTFTNNGAFTLHAADLLTAAGHVSILATDYTALADNSIATKSNVNLAMNPSTAGLLYCIPIARGTPTYAASGLTVSCTFIRD